VLSSTGALAGCRVLDFSRVLAGPYACQILGDLGADVIKIEQREGDYARYYPFGRIGPQQDGDSAYWIAVNRNKRSITVDFSRPEGRDIVRGLAAKADVLVENYKAGTLARHGLDYAALSKVNSRLVYCSVTGYGQDGPYAARPGLDPVFQAQSGFMQVNGEQGMPPLGHLYQVMDYVTGYNTAIAVLAALRERDQISGQGQHIDMALLDCSLAFSVTCGQEYLVTGRQPVRMTPGGRGSGGSGTYACRDGAIYVVIYKDTHFARFCEVMGRPDLPRDERFSSAPVRAANCPALMQVVEGLIAPWEARALSDALAAVDVPAGVVNDFSGAFGDPQTRHRAMTVTMPHPKDERLPLIANPAKLARTPPSYRRAPPLLGAHTEEVLEELLGFDAERVAALRKGGIV
jgi:crotonobetainyl-CoA:carnitine CoA-transferase CaiB-like acyl-CoA transferase